MNDKQPLAIITGGTGYLGSAIVDELRKSGWRVMSLARSVAKEETDAYECDITKADDVGRTIGKIIEQYGEIAACIHAASPALERKPILSLTADSFDESIQTAVNGAFLLAKAAMPHMREGAAFIGITSQAIEPGTSAPMGAYVPAKYALQGFLRVLAHESSHIRVYAVAPGFMPGGLNRDVPEKVVAFLGSKKDSGFCTPEDVASVVARLCNEKAAYPSGSLISVPSNRVDQL